MPLMMAKWSMGASMGFQSMNQEGISISNPFIAGPPASLFVAAVAAVHVIRLKSRTERARGMK